MGQEEFGKPSCSPFLQVDGDPECSFLVTKSFPRGNNSLQGASMQGLRLGTVVRTQREALGRQKPSGLFLAQNMPNDSLEAGTKAQLSPSTRLDTEYAEGLGAMNDTSPQEIGWEMYSKEN